MNGNIKIEYRIDNSNEEDEEEREALTTPTIVDEELNCHRATTATALLHKRKSNSSISITTMKKNVDSSSSPNISLNDEVSKDDSGVSVEVDIAIGKHLRNRDSEKYSNNRLVTKYGHVNLKKSNVERRKWSFTMDIFNTLLEVSWKLTLFAFCIAYFGSWLLFAVAWYGILHFHGDLDPDNLENLNGTWQPCITEIRDFTTAFLFSLETQHTTGYGFYQLTSECPNAIIMLCIQSIVGVILEGVMVGLVFVKLSRAKRRRATLMFSRNAVISKRDGKTYFMFRVADMRKNHLVEPRIRAQFIRKRKTEQGQLIRCGQQEFYVHGEGESSNRLFFLWPTTVIHEINSSSPFYKMTQEDLYSSSTSFEVIVILEGTLESSGLDTQARTSYLPHEILWDHYFYDMAETAGKCKESGERVLDFSLFHETFECSS